ADEADHEDEREQDEHPLRLPAQAREEHLLLYGAVAAAAASACSLLASMRLRALAAALRSSYQGNTSFRYLSSPSTRVASTNCGEPPNTTAAAGSSHGTYGVCANDTTVRSARLPGTSEPISSSRPSAR